VRRFLEVLNPNLAGAVTPEQTGAFVCDCIIRLLASLTPSERPEFLKVAYNGPYHMAALAAHYPTMMVGVLGGAGSTHRDTFELIRESERHGARLALFGRKINHAEIAKRLNLSRPTVITYLRLARERQIVGVKIAGVHFRVKDLADALCETYGLQSALETTYQVCEAAAQFFPDFVSPGDKLGADRILRIGTGSVLASAAAGRPRADRLSGEPAAAHLRELHHRDRAAAFRPVHQPQRPGSVQRCRAGRTTSGRADHSATTRPSAGLQQGDIIAQRLHLRHSCGSVQPSDRGGHIGLLRERRCGHHRRALQRHGGRPGSRRSPTGA